MLKQDLFVEGEVQKPTLTEIIKVDINTGQVMFYLLHDYDNNTE